MGRRGKISRAAFFFNAGDISQRYFPVFGESQDFSEGCCRKRIGGAGFVIKEGMM